MTDFRTETVKAMENAVRYAVSKMGEQAFRKTSFFASNERKKSKLKLAA